MSFFKQKKYLFSLLVVSSCVIFMAKPAYSQIDYSYGLNKKGLRLSLGLGGNTLQTTWSQTPVGYSLLGGLSYDLNNYFSIGVQGEYGSISGVDGTNTFYYNKSVNSYSSVNGSLRFSIGLLSDFSSQNGFGDAVKRAYIGVGYGMIYSKTTLTKAPNATIQGGTVPLYQATATTYKSVSTTSVAMIPISIGTNIALPGVWGSDFVELNPNIQYSLFGDAGVDGYQPTPNSTNGGYVLISASLRFKF